MVNLVKPFLSSRAAKFSSYKVVSVFGMNGLKGLETKFLKPTLVLYPFPGRSAHPRA